MSKVTNINEKKEDKKAKDYSIGYDIGLEFWELMDKKVKDPSKVEAVAGAIQAILNGLYYIAPSTELASDLIDFAKMTAKSNYIDAHKKD